MALRLKANRRFPSVPVVVDDPKNHTQVLMAVKEALDIGQRRTGDLLNSFVRVEDLIDLGLITIEGNTTSIVGADLSEIANIGDLSGAATGDFLRFNGTDWVNDQLHLSDITQAMVTQHQAALAITASQITDLEDIVPTWTGTHTFQVTPYIGTTEAEIAGIPGLPLANSALIIRNSPFILGVGAGPRYRAARIQGSVSAPTAVTSGLTLCSFAGYGYDGVTVAEGGGLFVVASNAWSGIQHGSRLDFHAVASDSVGSLGSGTIRATIGANATGAWFRMGTNANGGDGTATQPAYSWDSDTNTGIYRIAADTIGVATAGGERLRINGSGALGLAGANFGLAGQVLTSAGSGAAPSWQTATGGGGGDIATEILADSPTGYWKLDEASGNFADSSGNGNTLVASGTIRYRHSALTKTTPGVNYAYFTSGAGASIAGSLGVAVPLTGDWTIEGIVLFPTLAGSSAGAVFGIGNSLETEVQNFQALVYRTSSNALEAFWESGAGTNHSTTLTNSPPQPVPYHLIVVKDGTANTIRFYINGLQYGDPISYATEPTGGTDVFSGVGAIPGQTNNGCALAHVAFYNGIKLSTDRIAAHARAAGY
jgi:hypothetical protein